MTKRIITFAYRIITKTDIHADGVAGKAKYYILIRLVEYLSVYLEPSVYNTNLYNYVDIVVL